MKYAIAFLLLAGTAHAQSFLIDPAAKSRRIQFDPNANERRTIEIDYSSGQPVVTDDVTLPEGVGYIYIRSGNRATLEYSRNAEQQELRFWQRMPFAPAPFLPGYGH
jgi:hypothetical protein